MKKKSVSQEEVSRIIALRQRNTSWVGIQRETGVPRQIAKRTYEQWSRSQAREELKEARRTVAAEDFRTHRDCVIDLAEALLSAYPLPLVSFPMDTSGKVLEDVWSRDILGKYGVYGRPDSGGSHPKQVVFRQNSIVFQCLKAHTHERNFEANLREWSQSWDHCVLGFDRLQKKAQQQVRNFLGQEEGLSAKIEAESGRKDPINRMVEVILSVLWRRLVDGSFDPGRPVVRTVGGGDGMAHLTWSEFFTFDVLSFADMDLARRAEAICNQVAKNLQIIEDKETFSLLQSAVARIKKVVETLEEILNPLRLRPLILRTRCDLCPA